MVHGACLSAGCYAMTDPVIDEIWELVTAALDGGQKRFGVHIFPFRMTEPNFAILGTDRWDEFWHDLKKGYGLFEASLRRRKLPSVPGAMSQEAERWGAWAMWNWWSVANKKRLTRLAGK